MSGAINLDGFLDIATTDDSSHASIPDRNGVDPSFPKKRKKSMSVPREFILRDWLASLSLGEYHNLLFEEGYDKPLSLKVLTDEELIELGIKKKGHRIILLNAIKDEYFTSLTATPSMYYHGLALKTQPAQPVLRLQTPHYPQNDQPTYQQPIQQPAYQPPAIQQSTSNHQPPNQLQKARFSPGQLVPMSSVNSDSPTTDSDEDAPEPTTNGLSNSSDLPTTEPQRPALHYQSPPPPSHPLSPAQQAYRSSQRYQEEFEEDEDEEDSPQPTPNRYPSPPPPQSSQTHPPAKARPTSKSTDQLPTPSPTPSKPATQPSQSTATTTSTPSDTPKVARKRSRPTSEKPDGANPESDAPPKPKPAAITFIPKQHYSRSDIHDCLGGQRFCAISTPSAYPFILIFAHYQPYVGEDGMWEHIASGDLNKGVNRSVIHAKDKKKRLLLFFSMAGQQGAVLFLGEVKYVSSEQREEKNSKGVDKACVIFKFQRINNDAITINIVDYTKPDILAAQPKPVIRSLTDDPNTYYLDSPYSSNFPDANPHTTTTPTSSSSSNTTFNTNINNNNNNNSNNNNSNNNNSNNNMNNSANNIRRSLMSSTSSLDGNASSDAIPIIPINSPASSPTLSSSSTPSTTSFVPLSHSQHSLLPIKQERAGGGEKDDIDHVPSSTNNSSPNPFNSFSNVNNLSRTSISKLTHETSSLPNITRIGEKGERRERDGWDFAARPRNLHSTTPILDTRPTESSSSSSTSISTTETNNNNSILSNNNNSINNIMNDNSNEERDTMTNRDDFVVPTDSTQGSLSSIHEPSAMDTN